MAVGGRSLLFRKAAFEIEERIVRVRNFYGAISVTEEKWAGEMAIPTARAPGWRTLYHGGIVHGYQYLGEDGAMNR